MSVTTPGSTPASPHRISAVARYKAGDSTGELATAYGVVPGTIVQWLKDAGEPLRSMEQTKQLRRERRAELTQRAADLYKSGDSLKKVSAATGVSETQLRRWFCEIELPMRAANQPKKATPEAAEPEKAAAAVALYRQGELSYQKVGEQFGVPAMTVYRWVRYAGLETPTQRRKTEVTPQAVTKIRELYLDGASGADISAEVGHSIVTVYNYLHADPKVNVAKSVAKRQVKA